MVHKVVIKCKLLQKFKISKIYNFKFSKFVFFKTNTLFKINYFVKTDPKLKYVFVKFHIAKAKSIKRF